MFCPNIFSGFPCSTWIAMGLSNDITKNTIPSFSPPAFLNPHYSFSWFLEAFIFPIPLSRYFLSVVKGVITRKKRTKNTFSRFLLSFIFVGSILWDSFYLAAFPWAECGLGKVGGGKEGGERFTRWYIYSKNSKTKTIQNPSNEEKNFDLYRWHFLSQ